LLSSGDRVIVPVEVVFKVGLSNTSDSSMKEATQ
jgi:hypothetical protein